MTALAFPPSALTVNPDVQLVCSSIDASVVAKCQCGSSGATFQAHLTHAVPCPACGRRYLAQIATVEKRDGDGVYAFTFQIVRMLDAPKVDES